jgi:integrase
MSKRGNSEGSIYQRKSDGKWCGAISLPGAKRKVFYAKTQREVAAQLRAAQRQAEHGMLASGPDQTFGHYLADWLENRVKATRRPRTWESYEERVRLHIMPDLGHLRLRKLSPQHLQRLYVRKLSDGLSPTTVNHVHCVISSALAQATRWELVPRNVASLVEPPRTLPADPKPLSSETLAALLDALGGHRHENMWILMLGAGLRFGEAAGLSWDDIDFDGATVTVRHTLSRVRGGPPDLAEPKTPKSRRVMPVPPFALEAVLDQRIRVREAQLLAGPRWKANDFVFPSTVGTPLREAHVLKRLHDVLERAGLPRHNMRNLRSTYATGLVTIGVHPRVAQELLGHGRIDTTMRIYATAVPSAMREAANNLEVMLRPDSEASRRSGRAS